MRNIFMFEETEVQQEAVSEPVMKLVQFPEPIGEEGKAVILENAETFLNEEPEELAENVGVDEVEVEMKSEANGEDRREISDLMNSLIVLNDPGKSEVLRQRKATLEEQEKAEVTDLVNSLIVENDPKKSQVLKNAPIEETQM